MPLLFLLSVVYTHRTEVTEYPQTTHGSIGSDGKYCVYKQILKMKYLWCGYFITLLYVAYPFVGNFIVLMIPESNIIVTEF